MSAPTAINSKNLGFAEVLNGVIFGSTSLPLNQAIFKDYLKVGNCDLKNPQLTNVQQ
jgi:hypothetical protein